MLQLQWAWKSFNSGVPSSLFLRENEQLPQSWAGFCSGKGRRCFWAERALDQVRDGAVLCVKSCSVQHQLCQGRAAAELPVGTKAQEKWVLKEGRGVCHAQQSQATSAASHLSLLTAFNFTSSAPEAAVHGLGFTAWDVLGNFGKLTENVFNEQW